MKYLSESIKDTFNQVLMILISNVWGKYQFYQTNLPITSTINIKHTWRSETRLASYIWKLKDNGIPYTLKWNIHKWSRLILDTFYVYLVVDLVTQSLSHRHCLDCLQSTSQWEGQNALYWPSTDQSQCSITVLSLSKVG